MSQRQPRVKAFLPVHCGSRIWVSGEAPISVPQRYDLYMASKQHPPFERRKYYDWEAEPKSEGDTNFASKSSWPSASVRSGKRRPSLPIGLLVAAILLIVFGFLAITYFAGMLRP